MMWTKKNIGSMISRTAIVTGANSGIGYETALNLYEAGATVVVTARTIEKANDAIAAIRKHSGQGTAEPAVLDLSEPASIMEFADRFKANHLSLDLLINNAGVMMPPASKTVMGLETQFGVNFLGHFQLTACLYPLLNAAPAARVITVTSLAYLNGSIDFENLRMEKGYNPEREYAQSKLANLLFTVELQRRIDASGHDVLSLAAHPGITATNLARYMTADQYNAALQRFGNLMPASQGALPSLYAAAAEDVKKASLYGPDGENGLNGYPVLTQTAGIIQDPLLAIKLWETAETITGIRFL